MVETKQQRATARAVNAIENMRRGGWGSVVARTLARDSMSVDHLLAVAAMMPGVGVTRRGGDSVIIFYGNGGQPKQPRMNRNGGVGVEPEEHP